MKFTNPITFLCNMAILKHFSFDSAVSQQCLSTKNIQNDYSYNIYYVIWLIKSTFKPTQSNLSSDSAVLSSEKDSKIVLYHFLLTIIASILENGVSILNFREIFRSGKIGMEETFYVVEKWKIKKSREIFLTWKLERRKLIYAV